MTNLAQQLENLSAEYKYRNVSCLRHRLEMVKDEIDALLPVLKSNGEFNPYNLKLSTSLDNIEIALDVKTTESFWWNKYRPKKSGRTIRYK